MREERSKSSVMTVMFASYTSYFYEHLFSCFYHGIVTDILVYLNEKLCSCCSSNQAFGQDYANFNIFDETRLRFDDRAGLS